MPVPAELPPEVGALIGCGVTTGVGAVVNTARVEPGSSAVVIGCGGVGLSVVLGLALAGADPIVAVDLLDAKLDLARDLGATHAVRGDGAPAVLAEILPDGPDHVFEAIGLAPTIEFGLSLLPKGGTLTLVGMTPRARPSASTRSTSPPPARRCSAARTAPPARPRSSRGWRGCSWPASCRSTG